VGSGHAAVVKMQRVENGICRFEVADYYFFQLVQPVGIPLLGGAIRSAMASVDDWLVEKDVFTELSLPKDVTDPQLTPEQADVSSSYCEVALMSNSWVV
jgi:hypothetical protein